MFVEWVMIMRWWWSLSLSSQYQVLRWWSPTQNSCPTLFRAEQSTKKVRHRVNLSKLGKYVRAHQNIFMQFWTYKEDSFLPYLLKASKHLTILGEVWGALSNPGTCVWLNTRSPQLVQLKWIRGNLQRLFPLCVSGSEMAIIRAVCYIPIWFPDPLTQFHFPNSCSRNKLGI